MKLVTAALLAGSAAAFAPAANNGRPSVAVQESKADLESLAKKLNPVVGFFDPLGLADDEFWGESKEATIGFLRERYIVHANGITWPWAMQLDGTPFPQVSSAPEAWDSISDAAKWQIFVFIGFLEFFREANSDKHYMRGGKPGYFPPLSEASFIPGSSLDYFDPFGWSKSKSAEAKASGLEKEINNGRLAMIGILGFLSEGKTPGSVPALSGIIPAYSGEPMVSRSRQ
ncbi:MAG: hypothetical protein SGARI_006116 [Bacillariaceae sp.]